MADGSIPLQNDLVGLMSRLLGEANLTYERLNDCMNKVSNKIRSSRIEIIEDARNALKEERTIPSNIIKRYSYLYQRVFTNYTDESLLCNPSFTLSQRMMVFGDLLIEDFHHTANGDSLFEEMFLRYSESLILLIPRYSLAYCCYLAETSSGSAYDPRTAALRYISSVIRIIKGKKIIAAEGHSDEIKAFRELLSIAVMPYSSMASLMAAIITDAEPAIKLNTSEDKITSEEALRDFPSLKDTLFDPIIPFKRLQEIPDMIFSIRSHILYGMDIGRSIAAVRSNSDNPDAYIIVESMSLPLRLIYLNKADVLVARSMLSIMDVNFLDVKASKDDPQLLAALGISNDAQFEREVLEILSENVDLLFTESRLSMYHNYISKSIDRDSVETLCSEMASHIYVSYTDTIPEIMGQIALREI